MNPKVIGHIYLDKDNLTKEEIENIRAFTRVTKDNKYPVGNYNFSIPKHIYSNLSPEDVMMVMGYHPAGYGCHYNYREVDVVDGTQPLIQFQCSGSCD